MSDPARYLLHPAGSSPGHVVRVLYGGGEAFPAMLDAIRAARSEVLLETYIWADGEVGTRFAEALVERARAGVRVRVLVDGFGSLGLSESTRERLRAGGVVLTVFHPVWPWRAGWSWAVRDHRKLLVVDAAVAFLGGLNIADEYAPQSWGGRDWHDVHAEVAGTAVTALRRQFLSVWRHASGDLRDPPVTSFAGQAPTEAPTALVQVIGVGGLRERRRIRRHYQFLIRRARRTVRIMVGYFIPDSGWVRLLRNAALRGVDVRVMFPHHSDVPAVQWAARARYGTLLRAGVKVYEWLPSMLHAKVLSVDGEACAIGSYNLDRRSLLLNWELSILVAGGDVARSVERRFEEDQARCSEIDPARWAARGLSARAVERSSYALRRWL